MWLTSEVFYAVFGLFSDCCKIQSAGLAPEVHGIPGLKLTFTVFPAVFGVSRSPSSPAPNPLIL